MAKGQLARQWEIVMLLNGSRRGMRSAELAERLECGRATVDRALEVLRLAGVPLERDCVGGEIRHRLSTKPLPPLSPTPLQLAALRLAVSALSSLEGTRVLDEIRALLSGAEQAQVPSHLKLKVPTGKGKIVRTVESALEHGHRVRLVYRASSNQGQSRTYEVSPLMLRLVREQLYLAGLCEGKAEPRVFKTTRIESVEYLKKPAARPQGLDLDAWFKSAVKAWGGPTTAIEVRLKSAVAWLATEYPLVDGQTVEAEPDGSVRIRAEVSGLVEAKQWVLGWGSQAVALSPKELVEAVRAELTRALDAYPDPSPAPNHGLAKARVRDSAAATLLNKLAV